MFLNESNPIAFLDRMTATESAVKSLESAAFKGASTGSTSADMASTQLATPTGTAITQAGTAGSTNYTYVVAAVSNVAVAPAAGVQTTTGASTLNTTNYNIVIFNSVVGATYNIYRSASSGTPSSTGLIGSVTATATSTSFNDTGIAGVGGVPTTNTTGCNIAAGIDGAVMAIPTLSASGSQTLTVAHMVGGVLERTASTTPTDTMPTAAALAAHFPNAPANSSFMWIYRNHGSGTATLAVGTGGTSATGNTLTVATLHAKTFMIQLTNVTPGSESYTVYTVADSAF